MLDKSDWNAIYEAIRRETPVNEIVYGKVTAQDIKQKRVKVDVTGDQWLPLVGFNGKITYYDETGTVTDKKIASIEYDVPKIGQIAVVMRQMGERRLGKCVGIILSTGNFVE